MKTRTLTLTGGALAAALGAAVLLPAQERQNQNRNRVQNQNRIQNQNRGKNQNRARNQNRAQNRGQMREGGRMDRSMQNRDNAGMALEPTGFISIAADYDGDGVIDAIETIYAMDYVQARESSKQRMDMVNRRPRNVSGELTNLKKIKLSSRYGGPHMVGRVKTDRGTTAKVDFGPAAQVEELELTEGDRVDVEGRRGRINDKAMLLATKVSSDGNAKQIDRPKPSGLRRVKGEVTGLKTVKFRGRADESVVANMRLVSGREVMVNLGSKTALAPLNIQQGSQASLIGRPGSVNDEPALIATMVYAGGKSVDVSARGDRERMNMNR